MAARCRRGWRIEAGGLLNGEPRASEPGGPGLRRGDGFLADDAYRYSVAPAKAGASPLKSTSPGYAASANALLCSTALTIAACQSVASSGVPARGAQCITNSSSGTSPG